MSDSSMLPTPSTSSSTPEAIQQLRQEVEQQIAEKEQQLQDSTSGIGKSVLSRQIARLKERLEEMDQQEQQQQQPAEQVSSSSAAAPLHHSSITNTKNERGDVGGSEGEVNDYQEGLSPSTLEKLQKLERDIRSYQQQQQQQQQQHSLGPSSCSNHHHHHRKDKLVSRPTTSSGLDTLPSPSTSNMLPPSPQQGNDSSSLLSLPPPPSGSTPTKRRSKVPNTERRNNNIEFATEIGHGLLTEVRRMQALLHEKGDELKALQAQKADLERAAESLAKQLRLREENEEKLKEETWNLELAKQELTISVTQLQQSLNKANAEQKRMVEHMDELTTEIEHMRDREEKLSTTIEEMKQRHEHDMATVRRHAANLQREKADHAKQIEAMSSELAIAKAQSRIGRRSHSDLGASAGIVSEKNEEHIHNEPTPAKEKDTVPGTTSPTPSPNPSSSTRNHALEVETLKTSLAHAHRLVSNLRSNFRKEKTEKFEFKKLLSEAQERIEQLENDPRLWTDYPSKSSSSGNGPDSGGSSRRLRKANKRRAPVSKARMTTATNTRMHPDASDEDRLHKRHLGGETSDDDFSWNTDENEEEEDDDDTNGNMRHSAAKTGATTGAAATAAAGFTSLETELAKSQQKQTNTPKVILEPPSPTADNDGLRSLGDELDAANISKDDKVHVKEVAVQTEGSPLCDQIIPSFDIAPAYTQDRHTQSDPPITTDAESQCTTPYVVDQAIQMQQLSTAVDKHVQYESDPHENQGVDVSSSPNVGNAIDEYVQYDPINTMDAAMQTDEEKSLGSSMQQNGIAAGLGALAAATFGKWTGSNTNQDEKHQMELDESPEKIEQQPASDTASNKDLPDATDKSELYTKEQTDAMISAAVAAAVAKVKSENDATIKDVQHVPTRPLSPPPDHLLERVNKHDKGKSPARVRPSSNTSSLSATDNRASIGSSAYETTSLRNDGQIGLITQTMIGDWMWKYTRKAVGGGLSDHRHQRYFWIHPYTRTLYWSTKAPGTQGSDIKTKSALIEGVQAIPDQAQPPMPGVPNVSIAVKTDGRVIKFTAPTMAQHHVWIDALTYLASRGDNEDLKNGTRGSMMTSSNGSVARKQSIQRIFKTEHGVTPQFEQRHDDHDDDSDDGLEDVRMCCEGKHHVSRLERDHVHQRPFYPKRMSKYLLRHHHQEHHHSTQVPQQVN